MVKKGSVEISEDYGLRYHPITVMFYAADMLVDSSILIIYIVNVNENRLRLQASLQLIADFL